jgi:hypothetical protein
MAEARRISNDKRAVAFVDLKILTEGGASFEVDDSPRLFGFSFQRFSNVCVFLFYSRTFFSC